VIDYAESLLEKHATTGVLLDSNLLLLLIVGGARRDLIGKKRLNMFATEDYDTLNAIVSRADLIVTTPNILTEVSNLADALTGTHKDEYITSLVERLAVLDERYVPSHELIGGTVFNLFGLSDSAIAQIATDRFLIITIDLPLYQYLSAQELDVLNFNHIRTSHWT
jgi:hypothetical protein